MGRVPSSTKGRFAWDPTRRERATGLTPYPTRVELVSGKPWCLRIEYENGEAGEVDLSELLSVKPFNAWKVERDLFATVRIEGDTLAWDRDIDIAPETVYMAATGRSLEEILPVKPVG